MKSISVISIILDVGIGIILIYCGVMAVIPPNPIIKEILKGTLIGGLGFTLLIFEFSMGLMLIVKGSVLAAIREWQKL